MSLIKQLIPRQLKFTPASSEVNWTRIETLVHGPGAGVDTASINSAVFACLMTVASSYPEPPLCVYRKTSQGSSEKVEDHPLQMLLDAPTPNGELSADEVQFWTAWALHADGNAYWLKVRSGDALTGNVIQLWPISPSLMAPVTEQNSGEWISYYKYQVAPNQTVGVPVQNVVHFRLGLDDRDMRKGLAPLKHLVRQISTDDEADKFVDALLKNYAVPGLVVIPAQGVSVNNEVEADRIADKMRRKFGNDRRGNVAVMSKEVTVEQFGFSPKDLDLSVLHRIPEERISAVIGVPAIVAGLGAGLDRATYANFKEAREMFTEQKLVPQWRTNARKLNTSLKPDFTSDKRIYLEHDLTNVRTLQEDEDTKYKRLTEAVGKPFIKRNEARTDVGLDPIPEWDTEDAEPPAPAPVPVPNPNDANAVQPGQQELPQKPAKAVDLDKWQNKALKAIKQGRVPIAPFESDHIPDDEYGVIVAALAKAKTADDVRGVFAPHIKAAGEMTTAPELPFNDAAIRELVAEMKRANDLLVATTPQTMHQVINMPDQQASTFNLKNVMPGYPDIVVNVPEQKQASPIVNVTNEMPPTTVNVKNEVQPTPVSVTNEISSKPPIVNVRNEVQPTPVKVFNDISPTPVNVNVPQQKQTAPIVNINNQVNPTPVTVEVTNEVNPAAVNIDNQVNVQPQPDDENIRLKVERDRNGLITGVVEE